MWPASTEVNRLSVHSELGLHFAIRMFNPGPAELEFALSLLTVYIQIIWLLQKPTDLDLHFSSFSMWICVKNLDQQLEVGMAS